jgi:hypothetical protein
MDVMNIFSVANINHTLGEIVIAILPLVILYCVSGFIFIYELRREKSKVFDLGFVFFFLVPFAILFLTHPYLYYILIEKSHVILSVEEMVVVVNIISAIFLSILILDVFMSAVRVFASSDSAVSARGGDIS